MDTSCIDNDLDVSLFPDMELDDDWLHALSPVRRNGSTSTSALTGASADPSSATKPSRHRLGYFYDSMVPVCVNCKDFFWFHTRSKKCTSAHKRRITSDHVQLRYDMCLEVGMRPAVVSTGKGRKKPCQDIPATVQCCVCRLVQVVNRYHVARVSAVQAVIQDMRDACQGLPIVPPQLQLHADSASDASTVVPMVTGFSDAETEYTSVPGSDVTVEELVEQV